MEPSKNGLVSLKRAFTVRQTLDRLAHLPESRGLTVFCRIDHAANAVSDPGWLLARHGLESEASAGGVATALTGPVTTLRNLLAAVAAGAAVP